MSVRQVCFSGIGGLKEIDGDSIGSLKLDGSQYNLHIKNNKAYALTSKRISKKTNLLSDRIDNFPELKKMTFPFKKETIIVFEVVAEHLKKEFERGKIEGYTWAKRVSFIAGIMNAKPETVRERFPNGNPLKLVAFSILMYEGVDVSDLGFIEKQKILFGMFPSAGKFGEKLAGKEKLFRIETFKASSLGISNLTGAENYVRSKEFEYEGFVFFDPETNKSAKVKRMQTIDAIIIDADYNSTGKYKENGWIKSISVGLLTNASEYKKNINHLTAEGVSRAIDGGNLIHVGWISGMDENVRKDISENLDSWIGAIVEIEFMEWTGKALRHPRFIRRRSDKFINRCDMGQLE